MLNDFDEYPTATGMNTAAAIELPTPMPVEVKKITPAGKPAVVEEVLIEEVSIDGMCGVY